MRVGVSVQRGGRVASRVFGTTVVLLALACCVAVGLFITRTDTGRSSAAIARQERARRDAQNVAAERVELAADLTFAPARGATAVAPTTPIVVTAKSGRISNVRVTTSSGAAVPLDVSWSYQQWRSDATPAYSTDYRVTATTAGGLNVTTAARTTAPHHRPPPAWPTARSP